ncbi:ornithine cyclodeaminase family protein [Histidinibacterium aquaticum]|uniref:Ornithine cyclodeaminase n=1 Tax=Histidinibacterium aquaticum TaxID=2613962 RepID=A0A5J5GFS2_9RHOB|nr:ornithine cyclodeaminase [Histidinibacterium aquaticum]KAA9007035.1 ornithine cyclodeaminase [Histidinibacterium aquaticum]
MKVVPFEADAQLDWIALTEALEAGHRLPKAQVEDIFIRRGGETLLNRAAWIDGLGLAVKSATIFPENPASGMPMVNGAVTLFDDQDGTLAALVDFHLVTKWKTAGDSLLAGRRLARPDSGTILIVGAGTVGRSLRQAYEAAFPKARFLVWNRSPDKAEQFCDEFPRTEAVTDLEAGVAEADIVTCATMSSEPVIKGEWLRPGQHLDLIGAYRPDMREADDEALARSRIFVDSRDTTMGHIGELKIPLEAGTISPDAVIADYYEGPFTRASDDEITLFKNGGGAHLDLMTARYILQAWERG